MLKQAVSRASILIVDDEPANLKLLDRMLRTQGYDRLTLIDDPRQTIKHYQTVQPTLILLDLNMPHLDGYQVMEQLQALGDPLLPPIVILTAQDSADFLLRALSQGARDFISKPFDRHELLMRVRNLLEAQIAHRMLHDQKATLEGLVKARTEELYRTRLQVVQRLGQAAEYRDEETGNHILRMSHTCVLLARALGWDDEQCDLLLNASPMHDIGKIGIPDNILLKPGRLDADEMAIMKTHVDIGAKLLDGDDSALMNMGKEIAYSYHEKWDGNGYPQGLAGEAIPLSGRIAAIADVFDALLSSRPYKKAWTLDAALQYLEDNRGKHFDPHLVTLFVQLLPDILAIRARFSDQ
jgi:putative two-component system response regulator